MMVFSLFLHVPLSCCCCSLSFPFVALPACNLLPCFACTAVMPGARVSADRRGLNQLPDQIETAGSTGGGYQLIAIPHKEPASLLMQLLT